MNGKCWDCGSSDHSRGDRRCKVISGDADEKAAAKTAWAAKKAEVQAKRKAKVAEYYRSIGF